MNVDAVIDTPQVREADMVEFDADPGSRTHLPSGWMVVNDGTTRLYLRAYGTANEVWVWDRNGGKVSLHGTFRPDEGHLYRPQDDATLGRDGVTRGPLSVYRSEAFTGT